MSDTTFMADASGGQTFAGEGTGNTLELSGTTFLVTIDVPSGTVTGFSGGATDSFSDIQTFDGNFGSGGTTFIAGSIGGFTFVGEGGGGNTLDFSDASSGVSIFLTPNSQGEEVAQPGSGSDAFTGITTIIGSDAGGNTFVGGPGDYTVDGEGSNNTLDYSAASNGVAFNVSSGSGSAEPETGGDTTFSGIQIFKGSTAGDNIFTVGSGNQTLEGGGGNNEITFAADAAGITIDAATGTATTANGTDTFSDIQTFIGSSAGSTTFIVGSGSYTFESGGSGNTIVYTPQSNDVLAIRYSPASELLDFQGFGNSLNAQDVQNDATISNGNTYINIPGAGTIELANYTGGISQSDMEFTACYRRGTRIVTDNGEVTVEDLSIGDYVMTKSGTARPITWIGRRSYGGRFVVGRKDILPICIKAGALDDNVPKRDLWISPNHAMYLDGALIEAKDLVNGVSIVQAERVEKLEYFHVELESHNVIIAEGALSETYIDDDNRGMFHNAHEYRAAYPDTAAGPAQYCAARLDHGFHVEAVRKRLTLRAGLSSSTEARARTLRGYVDRISSRRVEGWAQNAEHPEAPVCLDIFVDDELISQVLANCYRDDLKRAGLGSGCHSFAFTPPDGVALTLRLVEVRRSLDGATLPLSAHAKKGGLSAAA